jgi:altered-inheritance-of-mitochondria protein 5
MGFTTGFVSAIAPPRYILTNAPQLGGVTLTSAVLYLTISMHTQNRMQQAALLRQQRQVLADFYEPRKPEPEPAPRVVPVGLVEMAKDRWNRSLEEGIQKIYNTDWRKVREGAEDRATALAEKIRQQSK